MSVSRKSFYDLHRLFVIREALERARPVASPTAWPLAAAAAKDLRAARVGVLCGSFNPLTKAHVVLARLARERFSLDVVLLTLARVTVDKERAAGMGLEDRLLLLSLFAQRRKGTGVALVNRGLYFEQAEAFRAVLGPEADLSFIVGMDKIFQILDPRYYEDRAQALGRLFGLASVIVANRGSRDEGDLSALLDRGENRPYRGRVRFLRLPAVVKDLSASGIRARLAAGRAVRGHLPAEVAAFIGETRVYRGPKRLRGEAVDAYRLRQQLFELLWANRRWAEREADFARLMEMALRASRAGAALRSFVRCPADQNMPRRLGALPG